MPIARTPWIDDDGSGTTGTVINNAEKTLLYNQIDAALATAGGTIVDVPFNAANFTTPDAGCTWTVTGSQVTYFYVVNNKLVTVSLQVAGSVITGSPIFLHVALPVATIARASGLPFTYYGTGLSGTGFARLDIGNGNVKFLRDAGGTAWLPVVNQYLYVQFVYSIP
jgi:hypothetical protein